MKNNKGKKFVFTIAGITCDGCIRTITNLLKKINGVKKANVKLDGSVELITSRPIEKTEVKKALNNTKYMIL